MKTHAQMCLCCIGVHQPTCSSLLQPQPLQDLPELLMLAEVRQFDVHTGPQSCAQVGRAGEDVAQVFVPHELVCSLLKQGLNLPEKHR